MLTETFKTSVHTKKIYDNQIINFNGKKFKAILRVSCQKKIWDFMIPTENVLKRKGFIDIIKRKEN